MTEVVISSILNPNGLKNARVKSHLKVKEKHKIAKAIGEHTYELENGRRVMDAQGVKNALGMDNESTMIFFEHCDESDLFKYGTQTFVYSSTVFKKANSRTEQPFDTRRREKSRYCRDLLIETVKPNDDKSN